MSATTRSPRRELLARLLESHERSVSYGRSTPWPREVILRLDARTFPDAFAPEGRERRAALVAAAGKRGPGGLFRCAPMPRALFGGNQRAPRRGPAEIVPAYEAAQALGYEPLAVGLAAVERHAARLQAEAGVAWMRSFLETVATSARTADLSLIGMSRQRFKHEWRDLIPALTAAVALAAGVTPAWERVVSERLFRDSKMLGRVRSHIVALLVRADPRWEGVPPEEATELLEAYGVRRKPGLIRCAGAAMLRVGDAVYRLEDFTPAAHLPDSWAGAWVEALAEVKIRQVTTVENEYPFLAYVEEAGGPAALGARGEVAVYTAGFPTPALVAALSLLSERATEASFRHWGDADVGGMRIWWFLRSRLRRPIALFRTTAEWISTEATRGGRSLSGIERAALERLRAEIETAGGTDVPSACEAIAALLRYGVKIEQERY